MNGKYHHPVAIIGAGPTGLTLANLLGLAGIRTVLIERNTATVSEPRAVSIDDESLRTMQAAGLVDEVLADVMLDYGSHYFDAHGRCFAKVEPNVRDYGYPRRNAFHQPRLEATLRSGLERFEHVTVLFAHEVLHFSQTPDAVTLMVKRASNETIELTADWLVACDGGRSSVRSAIGAVMEGASFEQRWLIVDLLQTTDRFRHTRVFSNPDRPAISLPGPYRSRRFEFKLRDDETDEHAESEEFARELVSAHGPDGNAPIVRKQVYTFHARIASHWRKGRVFLAGDAAHLTPPFAGQGMNSGIRDAHNLAWKLAAVVKRELPVNLLDTYEAERIPHARALIDLALTIGRVMVPTSPLNAALQQAFFRLLKVCPPALRYVTQMRFKPKPHYRNGFLLNTETSRTSGLVGRMIPQPTIETADGRQILLDDALGNRMALLAYGHTTAHDVGNALSRASLSGTRVLVGVVPKDCLPDAGGGDDAVYRDADGALGRFLGLQPDIVLVIRPDRYIAAALTVAEMADFPEKLDRFFAPISAGSPCVDVDTLENQT